MNDLYRLLTLAAALSLLTGPARAESGMEHKVVRELGEINGIALNCNYAGQVRMMKRAMVRHAPKTRAFGRLFDEATNDSFLRFIEEKRNCPSKEALSRRVKASIKKLRRTFNKHKR